MKIVVVTSRFPFPIEKGDKLRMYNHLKFLSEKFQIVLIALHDGEIKSADFEAVKSLCSTVHVIQIPIFRRLINAFIGWLDGLPLQVAYFYHRKVKDRIHALILKENPQAIYSQLIRTVLYTRNLPYFKVLDYMDCFSLLAHRRSKQSVFFEKWFWELESTRIKQLEQDVFFDFNRTTVITSYDREHLPVKAKHKVQVVSNGVNTEHFRPSREIGNKKYYIVITGNMGYRPNVRAAQFLITRIMPFLPGRKLLVAGARPARALSKNKNPEVVVTGWMEDIRQAYWLSEIFVAPIFEGAGIQNKVLEAMACGLPCVVSSVVNNGIGAVNRRDLLVGDDEKSILECIYQIGHDEKLRHDLGRNARDFVKINYSWDHQNKKLEDIFLL